MEDLQDKIIELMDLFDDEQVTTADKIDRPERALEKQAIDDFVKRNPMAGGGMLVQPGFGGTRQGYADKKIKMTIEEADRLGIPYEIKQGKNKGKFAIRTPKEKKYKFFKTAKQAAKYLADYKKITKVGGDTTLGLETKKYPKGYLTKKQFVQFLSDNNISGKNPANFAGNYGINTKVNPYNKNTLIYDTSQFTPEKIESIQRAQVKTGTATEYAKKLFPPKTKSELQKPRLEAIEAKGGIKKNDPFAAPRGSGAQLGHTGNIFGTELITGDRLAYTPSQVNELMSRKGNLDDKIRTVSAKIENIKKSNKSPKVKKDLLEQADNILIRLASQSQGFKKVTLSDESTFGGDRLTIDSFDIYKGKTEKEIVQLQKQYLNKPIITEEMAAKNPNLKATSPEEIAKIQDAYFFEENRKASLKAAQKFPKQELDKLILNLASTVTDKCAVDLKADGGRIGYSLGSEACLKIGKEALDNGLIKGFKNKQQVDLAGLILKGGAGLKSAFALRNIFGPAAIAATVAFEGGLIGYDMLTSGKTLREAFGDNLLNYALGKDYQIDPQEELFKRFKGLGYDDQQIGGIKKALDAMNTINTGAQLAMDVGQQQEALQKSRGQPEPFMSPDDQMMADTSGQRAEQNLKDARERLTAFNQSLEAVDRPGGMKKEDVLSEYFSSGKYAEDLDLFNQAEKEANIQKLESTLPTAFGTVFPKFEERRQEGLADLRSVINPAFNIPGARDATFIPGKTTGGLFGLAEGGRAGYKLGKIVKVKPSKVRADAKSIIDENAKLMKQMKETGEIDEISSDLNQVIKKALDEDLFDKKDRIVDSINISEAKKRRNYPYNMQVFEEPKNLDFYRNIKESDFRTKTGPYYDRIRRNKAGGGILKQAGDRSGPPPESGPNSQGLQGLLNRVKKG